MTRSHGRSIARGRILIVLALALVAAGAASTLTPATGLNTLVSSSSPDYRATSALYRRFGSDPVVVLVRAQVNRLLAPADITRLSQLEACLAGQQLQFRPRLAAYVAVGRGAARPYGGGGSPCGALMRLHAAWTVYGPGTLLNHAVAAVNGELASLTANAAATIRAAETAAREIAHARGLNAAQTAAAVQAAGELALERELTLAAGSVSTGAGTGKGSLSQALLAGAPSIKDRAFLHQIVFGSGGTAPSQRFAYLFPTTRAALIQVRLAASLRAGEQQRVIALIRRAVGMRRFQLPGVSYSVAGEPVLLSDLGGTVGGQLRLLLGIAVAVMALVLLVWFRRRGRLLPLLGSLSAVAIISGLAALVSGTLTVADVAVFPVLLGLGVDYGIQLRAGTPRALAALAATATGVGFVALLAASTPMVRGFGGLLVAGVAVAFAVAAFTTGAGPAPSSGPPRLVPEVLIASVLGAGEILAGVLPGLLRHPRRALALAVAVAVVGWALIPQTAVQSDITRLVPAGMPALAELSRLEQITGSSGEVDVLVGAPDVTSARTVAWMRGFEGRVSSHFGSSDCRRATLCPVLSLPSLLRTAGGSLGAVPSYFQRSVLTPDHRHALLAFGIRLMPLSAQRRVLARLRALLRTPAGISARLAGLPVLAVDAESALASLRGRLLMLALSLALVALALLLALRNLRRTLLPLVPIVLATGWSGLLLYLLRIPLNPMSASLGTLVIAITTEFSVLLSERICAQRGAGIPLPDATRAVYRTTGVAVLTSALTALAGFAVLILSNIPMLRDFGVTAVVDLAVSLAGVMLVLPATLGLIQLRAETPLRPTPVPTARRPGEPAEQLRIG